VDEGKTVGDPSVAQHVGEQPPPDAPDHSDGQRPVSKIAWAVLAVLALGAIALALMKNDVLLKDDFTTPEVLRTWPDDGATLTYADGAYRMSVLRDDGSSSAFQELPRPVGGMTLQVNAEASQGQPVVLLECVSRMNEVASPDGADATTIEVEAGYSFVLLSNERYLIAQGDQVLSSGRIASDGSDRVTAGCVGDGSGNLTLTLRLGDAEPVEVVDSDGLDSFVAVGLGVYGKSSGAAVTYDDLEVVEAS
jgi:hypothetical protein